VNSAASMSCALMAWLRPDSSRLIRFTAIGRDSGWRARLSRIASTWSARCPNASSAVVSRTKALLLLASSAAAPHSSRGETHPMVNRDLWWALTASRRAWSCSTDQPATSSPYSEMTLVTSAFMLRLYPLSSAVVFFIDVALR
jgi:hypothetical protein